MGIHSLEADTEPWVDEYLAPIILAWTREELSIQPCQPLVVTPPMTPSSKLVTRLMLQPWEELK